MCVLQKIANLINENRLQEAIEILDRELTHDNNNDRFFFERGKLHWRLGNKARAISDYEHAIALNPHSQASIALDNARDIISFFNTDLYNP